MKKSNLIIIGVIILLAFLYFNGPRPKTNKEVKPYIERFLDLLISGSYDEIYTNYLANKNLSHEDFNKGIDYFLKFFGKLISYNYKGSHIGGIGYFLNYSIKFSDGNKHNCSFSFTIDSKNQTFTIKDLERLSISANYGEKGFELLFPTGQILGGSKQTGGFTLGG